MILVPGGKVAELTRSKPPFAAPCWTKFKPGGAEAEHRPLGGTIRVNGPGFELARGPGTMGGEDKTRKAEVASAHGWALFAATGCGPTEAVTEGGIRS